MTLLGSDRFEIERLAGKGGMGTVFRALDRTTGSPVALKIVDGEHANARFEREAVLLSQLRHPHIVRYVVHGTLGDGRMFLAMEWLEGVGLEDRIAAGDISEIEALAIARTLASALGTAHEAGIVHRDLKPSNVLLRGGRAADAVLVDFGVARTTRATMAMTKTGAVLGTPAYMAPEQARAAKGVDARVDVFALGCVLFECLTGRAAFVGEHVIAVLAKILLESAPRLSSLRPDLPFELDDLVARMLAKDASDRPADGTAVAAELERIHDLELPRHSAPRPSIVARQAGIGAVERRFATVLLASPCGTHDALGVASTEAVEDKTREERLQRLGTTLGITITPLANGMYVGAVAAEEGARDAAERAVRCGLELAKRVPDVAVAIASGHAIVSDHIPVGEVIDRAACVLAIERSASVIVDDTTASIVEAGFVLERRGNVSIVRGEREAEARQRTVLGRVIPFVGREREISLLAATYRECIDEPVARAVLVVAPPGTGKSRLARELGHRLASADEAPTLWIALAQPTTLRTPFGLAGDLFRRVLGVVDDAPNDDQREEIRKRVHAHMSPADAARAGRFLATLVGATCDEDDPVLRAAQRNPELMRAQIEDAVRSFVVAELAHRPVVLVLEDVHWADAASLRLLGGLLASARDRPLMILALARPSIDEVHPALFRDARTTRIDLEPLLRKASEKLARAVLGDRPEIAAIVRRADGNALFVEELARACAEGLTESQLPPTVVAATEARLLALDPDTRHVLRAASIFGERFWAGAVSHVVGGGAVDARLGRLEKLEIVSLDAESRFAGEHEYVFRHALVRDAAYAMLTDEDRVLGHGLAGDWLRDRVDDGALLADHYERGGRPTEAARHHARAAEQALVAQDFDATFRHAERAESLGAAPPDLGAAHAAAADAALWLGDNVAAMTRARAALEGLERGGEKWFVTAGVLVAAAGKTEQHAGFEGAVAELLCTDATDTRSDAARLTAYARAVIQAAYFGDLPRADALLGRCEEEATDDPSTQAWMLLAAAERGHAAGVPLHPSVPQRARELFVGIGDTRAAISAWATELQLYMMIGEFELACSCAEDLLVAGGATSRFVELYVQSCYALRAAWKGDFAALLAFTSLVDAPSTPRLGGYFRAATAQMLFTAGHVEEARGHAESVLERYPRGRAPSCASHAVLARIAARAGNATKAVEHAEQAQSIVRTGVAISAVASFHLALARAAEVSGRRDALVVALREGVARIDACAANLGEHRTTFFASYDGPELFALARAHGVPVSDEAPPPT